MPDWHTDFFALKLLKNQPVQEHSYPPLSLETKKEISPLKGTLPVPGDRETSLSPEIQASEPRTYFNKACYFLTYLPHPPSLDFFSLPCQFFTNLFLC